MMGYAWGDKKPYNFTPLSYLPHYARRRMAPHRTVILTAAQREVLQAIYDRAMRADAQNLPASQANAIYKEYYAYQASLGNEAAKIMYQIRTGKGPIAAFVRTYTQAAIPGMTTEWMDGPYAAHIIRVNMRWIRDHNGRLPNLYEFEKSELAAISEFKVPGTQMSIQPWQHAGLLLVEQFKPDSRFMNAAADIFDHWVIQVPLDRKADAIACFTKASLAWFRDNTYKEYRNNSRYRVDEKTGAVTENGELVNYIPKIKEFSVIKAEALAPSVSPEIANRAILMMAATHSPSAMLRA